MLLTFQPMAHIRSGESVLGSYFETFYLPLWGPAVIVTSRFLARQLQNVEQLEIADDHLGTLLGLPGTRGSDDRTTHSIHRTLGRMRKLSMLAGDARATFFTVRLLVDPLKPYQVERLPLELQERHRQLMSVAS